MLRPFGLGKDKEICPCTERMGVGGQMKAKP